MIRVLRWLTGAIGLGVGLYGAKLLADLGTDNLRAAGTWLIGGVLLHDAVLAPATLALWFLLSRPLGGRLPKAVVVGAVVLGSVTLVGWPVLGRHLARPGNDTLLDRDYTRGWLVLAGLTLAGVVVALARGRRTTKTEVG